MHFALRDVLVVLIPGACIAETAEGRACFEVLDTHKDIMNIWMNASFVWSNRRKPARPLTSGILAVWPITKRFARTRHVIQFLLIDIFMTRGVSNAFGLGCGN